MPPFVRIDVQRRVLSSVDGARTSPITQTHRTNGRLMLQGMQNQRVWGAVINEQTGRMWATVGEDDGAIVLSGSLHRPVGGSGEKGAPYLCHAGSQNKARAVGSRVGVMPLGRASRQQRVPGSRARSR